MRLTLRLTAALTCVMLLVLGVNAAIRIQRELALFDEDVRKDSRILGRILADAVSRMWSEAGEKEALDLVADADAMDRDILIRWLWIEGDWRAQSPPIALTEEVRDRLRRGEEVLVKARSREERAEAHYTFVPVTLPGGRMAAIQLRESLVAERAYLKRSITQAVISTAALVVLCGLLASALGVAFVGRRVRRLVEHARRIGTGDLSPSLVAQRRDEIGDLASEMNAMCFRLAEARDQLASEAEARLATVEQLRHADRLTTVGKLGAGIAHEVGTPLNVITGYAQLIRDDYAESESAHQSAVVIAEQAQRVATIIRQLLDFARQRTLHKEVTSLQEVAGQVVSLLDSLARKKGVELVLTDSEQEIQVEIDPHQIQQVLANLVVNGIHATDGDGKVTIGVESRPRRARDAAGSGTGWACVYVEDEGPGIAGDTLSRIFEPFFTTKGIGEGTGLGLSVAYGIVKEHGGQIEVETHVSKGSRFTVWLPLEGALE